LNDFPTLPYEFGLGLSQRLTSGICEAGVMKALAVCPQVANENAFALMWR
jgi:hypothetical protein